MSDFDDPVVRDQLQRLAGHHLDDDVAYANLMARVHTAKRHRVVVAVSVACGAALIVVGASLFVNRDTRSITPVANSSVSDPVITDPEPTTAAPTSTDVATSSPTTEASSTAETVPSISVIGGTSVVETTPPPTSPPPKSSPSSSATPAAPANPTAQTFSTKGGTLTIQTRDGAMSIAGHHENPGYTFQIDRNDPDRIRVRFLGDGVYSRITVVLKDGKALAYPTDVDQSTVNSFDFPNGSEDWHDRNNGSSDGSSDGTGGSGSAHDGRDSGSSDGWGDGTTPPSTPPSTTT